MGGKRKKELDALMAWVRAHPKLEYGFYALLALLALALFLTGGQKKEFGSAPSSVQVQQSGEQLSLEERLAGTLSCIEGAGRVEVLISYESGEEIVPALSVDVEENQTGGAGSTSRSEQPVTVSSDGGEEPLVLLRRAAQVRGAIVVAEGASDVGVRMDLQRAAQAVLDIPASRIEVFSMKRQGEEN